MFFCVHFSVLCVSNSGINTTHTIGQSNASAFQLLCGCLCPAVDYYSCSVMSGHIKGPAVVPYCSNHILLVLLVIHCQFLSKQRNVD